MGNRCSESAGARTGAASFHLPVSTPVDRMRLRTDHLESPLRVGRRQPRPPDEVTDRRRAMTAEIPPCQLGECFVTWQAPRIGRAIGKSRVGLVLAATRAAADHAFELCVDREHRKGNALRGDPGAREMRAQFNAGERLVERAFEYGGGARAQSVVEPQFAPVVRERLMHARGGQFEHPPDVR